MNLINNMEKEKTKADEVLELSRLKKQIIDNELMPLMAEKQAIEQAHNSVSKKISDIEVKLKENQEKINELL